MKVKLIANKAMTYGTRHLEAGEPFEAIRRDARVLIAQKRAKEFTGDYLKPEAAPAAPPAPPSSPSVGRSSEIADVRAQYEAVTGRKPFNGWDLDTLQDRIKAHQAEAAAGQGATDHKDGKDQDAGND